MENHSPMIEKPRFSVVTPIFNEEGNIALLYQRLSAIMDSTGEKWEFIAVNDGSRDRSPQMLDDLAASDSRVRVLHFARNFGHAMAVTAGIDYATGDAVI